MVGIGNTEKITPFGPNEAEVTLIGGTSGYGESIVVRYGENEWAIIDSCIDTLTQTCLPIAYLNDIGVNVKTQVKYVFCTHWHDDHIRGLHELIEACSNDVVFCLAIASDKEKFLYEMERSNLYEPDRGVRKELILALDKVNEKGISVKRLMQDLTVFKTNNCSCFALSPSQEELKAFFEELAHVITEQGQVLKQKEVLDSKPTEEIESAEDISDAVFSDLERGLDVHSEVITERVIQDSEVTRGKKKTCKSNINDRSVALLFTICGHHVVLGADLEVSSNSYSGWQSVNDCSSMQGVAADMYKIPHHGSSNGYFDLFIKNHISPSATGKLSTWLKGESVLPEKIILENYHQYLSSLFITADPSFLTGKFSSPEYKKMMEGTTESIVDIKNHCGIVQSRLDLSSGGGNWITKVYGSAREVTDALLERMI